MFNHKLADAAPGATYVAAGVGAVTGGLHISDVCAIVSVFIALLGFLFQVWVQTRRTHVLEKKQVAQEFTNVGTSNRVSAIEQEIGIVKPPQP